MLVLDVAKRLKIEDCNRHIHFTFNIDKEAKELKIFFKYTPPYLYDKEKSRKMIEQSFIEYTGEINYQKVDNYIPLRNLLTISLSSPNGWIGTAHRHLKSYEHYISNNKASRGFHTSKIEPGKWIITVSVFSILTDYVDVELVAEVKYD